MTPISRPDIGMAPPVLAITGATGFIGQALVHAASENGWQPRLLVRRYPHGCLPPMHPVQIVLGDLGDPAALRDLVVGATVVVHLAGVIKALTTRAFFHANADGTEALLQAVNAAQSPAAVVHVSSLVAREPNLSPYAASKAAGEDRVRQLAGDRSWAIIRPPAVYGPGDPATLPLFKAAAMGFLPYPAAKGAQVALIHVHDVAMAIVTVAGLLAAGKLPSGQCLELDDGRSDGYQWSEIIAALATAVGHPVRHVRLPRLLLWPIAAANTIRATLTRHAEVLTTAKMAELYHRDWRARPSEFFGPGEWKARFTLEKGFSHTCEWYRKHSLIS